MKNIFRKTFKSYFLKIKSSQDKIWRHHCLTLISVLLKLSYKDLVPQKHFLKNSSLDISGNFSVSVMGNLFFLPQRNVLLRAELEVSGLAVWCQHTATEEGKKSQVHWELISNLNIWNTCTQKLASSLPNLFCRHLAHNHISSHTSGKYNWAPATGMRAEVLYATPRL